MSESQRRARLRNLFLAGIAGLAGFMIILLVLVALFIGLWLDAQLGRRGPCTIGLIVLSAPASLWLVFRIVLRLLAALQPVPRNDANADSSDVGGNL
jgi:hypothetical protein